MDVDEEMYYVLYLYNAVAEYILFLIMYIEQQGPANPGDLCQYIKFFKHEIHEFIFMFGGMTQLEKFCNMLQSTSKAFLLSDGKLFLSTVYKNFKESIFQNLVITRSADLISKGIFKIEDICNNLKLNNIMHVEPKDLSNILQNYPYFEIQDDSSASLIQFHGLLGFDNYCYEAVVCYFHSFLQNAKVLSFSEVVFHSALVPSCGVQNVITVFCMLYTCEIFKCRNSKVSLRLKPKKKPIENKPLDIKFFEAQLLAKVPLGLLIYEAYGSHLHDWVGEVGKLKHNYGYIYCVVSFSDKIQYTFIIYFNQTALKQVCEVENLEDYVKIHDSVKFDAIHCFEARNTNIYWKATKLKIVNMPSKISKRLTKIEHFETESIFPNYISMKEKCIHPKCFFNKFEHNLYDVEKLRYCSLKLSRNECTCKELETFRMSKSLKDLDCVQEKSLVESSLNDFLKTENSREKQSSSSKIITVDMPLSNKCSSDSNLLTSKAGISISNETSEYNDESEISAKTFSKEIGYLLLNKNTCNYIFNFMFLEYAFMVGKVTSVMPDKGTAIVMHKNKCYNIFFRKEAIFPTSEHKNVFQKGKKILIFIPYIEEKNTLHVATLIHPLNSLETAKIEMSSMPAKELVSGSPILKSVNNDLQFHEHYLPIGFLLSKTSCDSKFFEYRKLLDMNNDFEDTLSKLFSYNNGVYHMLVWIILYFKYEQDVKIKPVTNIFHLLSYIASYFHIKKNSVGPYIFRKKIINTKRKRRLQVENTNCFHEQIDYIKNTKENCNKFKTSKYQYPVSAKGLAVKNLAEWERSHENVNSCSLNSFKTCGSQSSLDTFHSCESLIDETVLNHTPQCKSSEKKESCDSQTLPSINFKSDVAMLNDGSKHSCNSFSEYPNFELKSEETIINLNTNSYFIYCKNKLVKRISPFGVLKFRTLPIFKHKLQRRKTASLKLNIYNCSYFQVIKATANISVITDTCIFLRVKCKDFDTLLGYPTKVIPKEMKEKLKLNAAIEIEIVPKMPLHFSHVLSIKMCDTP